MKVGVLALQGAFREHAEAFDALGADVTLVRLPEHLASLRSPVAEVHAIAGRHGTTPLRAALAWVRSIPGIGGILLGAESVAEIGELSAAAQAPIPAGLVTSLREIEVPQTSLIDPRRWRA